MAVNIKKPNEGLAATMAAAMKSNDTALQEQAWAQFHSSITEQIMADFEEVKQSNDSAILVNRGYRQLTTQETAFYQKLTEALKAPNPKQAFADILGEDIESDIMPETIIEDVYKNLQEEHALLAKVNFTYVKFATKWILNDHSRQKAVWGSITDEIAKEITSGFKVIDVNQSKLSAFAFVERGMLDLGPVFLDAYIRAVLAEAMLCGLEYGIVKGKGVDEPVGAIRDIHEGVTVSTTNGYPEKTAIKLKTADPVAYGALLAKLAKTEGGHMRKFDRVQLLCNMSDYLTKVMPASTALTTDGRYVNGLFPFPTEVIITNELDEGVALIGLLSEYDVLIGGEKNGVVEFSDEFKFLQDLRYFKIKQYGTGRAFDDTSFIKVDISELTPTYITVNALTTSAASSTQTTTPTTPTTGGSGDTSGQNIPSV